MSGRAIRSIGVIGGGVVGWAAAAACAARLPGVEILVVEEPQAPPAMADLTCAAPPSIVDFHRDLRVSERAIVRDLDCLFRLGTMFDGWGAQAAPYLHCHGEHGETIGSAPFHQHWLRLAGQADAFADHSISAALARRGSFAHPAPNDAPPFLQFGYGLHLAPSAYAVWLRAHAIGLGVMPVDGGGGAELNSATGHVAALILSDGQRLAVDLFIDAVGHVSDAVGTKWQDWSHWLPASWIGVGRREARHDWPLVEQVEAFACGWRAETPLRTASAITVVAVEPQADDALTSERRFRQGRRAEAWTGNVVAIGDAALVLEPLEGIPLHIAFTQIDRIIAALPGRDFRAVEIADYNRQAADEADRLRDFVALHYQVAARAEPLWRDLAATLPPDSLAHDLALFRARGHLPVHDGESFPTDSWLAVLIGSGVRPRRIDPVAAELPAPQALAALHAIRAAIERTAAGAPNHRDYVTHLMGMPA